MDDFLHLEFFPLFSLLFGKSRRVRGVSTWACGGAGTDAVSRKAPRLKEECLFSLALSPQVRKRAFGLFVGRKRTGERERK